MNWIPITQRAPTQEDANDNGDVLWLRDQWECLGKWNQVPIDAIAWKQACV